MRLTAQPTVARTLVSAASRLVSTLLDRRVRPTRRTALALLFTSACAVRDPADALIRACRYLWSQQAEDGGWHSRTYGLLRSGQSLTPFVLNALLQVPHNGPA